MPRQIKRGLYSVAILCLLAISMVVAGGLLLPLQESSGQTQTSKKVKRQELQNKQGVTLAQLKTLGQIKLQNPLYTPQPAVRKRPPLKLKLMGTSMDGDQMQAFVINQKGQMVFVKVGDVVDGATIKTIDQSAIVVEIDQEQQTFNMESK
ncbi:hypothetical protein JD969_03695 [Planctomycetota bacterium]|nr:hypothetical protein JD969_17805 [Planctomycetota bacterium]QQE12582.1 hypothetical protein JD969_03695 [Planctomycetota bacterium]